MGIDRQRIVDNFYPPGLRGRRPTSRRAPSRSAARATTGTTSTRPRPRQLLAEAGFAERLRRPRSSYRDVVRGYLPDPTSIAPDIQAQLKDNLGINVDDRRPGVGRPSSTTATAGKLDRHLPARLGRRLPGPDQLPRLPLRRRRQQRSSATSSDDIDAALTEGAADGRPTPRASRPTRRPTTLIRQHVPMVPIAHGGSATAFKADVEGAHSSPLGNEEFAVMKPGDRDTARLHAERRAARPVLRRRDRRRDAPRLRADRSSRSTPTRSAARPPMPALATECTPNADLTSLDLHAARRRRRSTTARPSTPTTSSPSYAAQWDAEQPAPRGPRPAPSTYFAGLVRWVPEPAAAGTVSRVSTASRTREGRRQPAAPSLPSPPDHRAPETPAG